MNTSQLKQTRLSRRSQAVAKDLRPQFMEPQTKPGSLEPRVTGDENPFTIPELFTTHVISLPRLPGRVPRIPQAFKEILVPQRIHRLPEAGMLERYQLSIESELF